MTFAYFEASALMPLVYQREHELGAVIDHGAERAVVDVTHELIIAQRAVISRLPGPGDSRPDRASEG